VLHCAVQPLGLLRQHLLLKEQLQAVFFLKLTPYPLHR
jgi:hypothetical protein